MKKVDRNTKIAVLIRNFSESAGGAEKYCYELTKLLVKQFDVHLFTQSFQENINGLKIHKVPAIKKSRFMNQILFSFYTKFLTKNKFDIIHSHDIVTHADVFTVHVDCFRNIISKKRGLNKVLSYISILLSPRLLSYFLLEKLAYRNNKRKRFICVSNKLKNLVVENYPNPKLEVDIAIPGMHINMKRNKVNEELLRKNLKIPSDAIVFLFVGNDFLRKGLQYLIGALEKSKLKNFKLLVAGNGKTEDVNFSSKFLKKNTIFLGEFKDMVTLYDISDILVHPTQGDTFGMTVLEAMSRRKPVIVSSAKYCGISESLSDEDALILKSPKSITEILHFIELLTNDSDLYKKIAKSAELKAKSMTWQKTFENTVKSYKKL